MLPEVKKQIMDILEKVKQKGEMFITTLTSEELRELGFYPLWGNEEEFFSSFNTVDIYLIYDGKEFAIRYEFDDYQQTVYYDRESELGQYFLEVVDRYLEFVY
jgi:hypothetical protein